MNELNQMIDKATKVEKLLSNAFFKEIILKDFLEESVIAIASNLNRVKPESRSFLVEQLMARNILRDYLQQIVDAGSVAKEEINEENNIDGNE